MFHGMKAEHRHIGNATDSPPAILSAQRVAGVFDQDQCVLRGQLAQGIKVGGMSGVVDGDDGFGAR